MTQTNCIIFIFIFKMLFWGNNCLLISSQEQPDANMQNAETVITTEFRAPSPRAGLTPTVLGSLSARRGPWNYR